MILLLVFGMLILVTICMLSKKSKEKYVDPYYVSEKKLMCDIYPRSNGSIYGPCSHLFSGYAYYDKAY